MKTASLVVGSIACLIAPPPYARSQTVERVPIRIEPRKEAPAPGEARGGAEKSLRFITDLGTPPFSFEEAAKPAGFEIDLGEALAKQLGAKAVWIHKNFNISTYASALDGGSADAAIASISITEKRKKRLSFTRPYFRTSLAVAVQKDINWKPSKFRTGLKNWLVGVVRGTTGEEWARKNLSATVKTYSSTERMVQALKGMTPRKLAQGLKKFSPDVHEMLEGAKKLKDLKGETGFCIIQDRGILLWALSRYGYRFDIVERELSHEDYGIAVQRGNTKLLSELNDALGKLDGTGEYDKIYAKWYSEAKDLPLFEK